MQREGNGPGFFFRGNGDGNISQNERNTTKTDDSRSSISPGIRGNVGNVRDGRYYTSKKEALKDTKDGYKKILEISNIIGIPITDLKQLTLNEINDIGLGFLKRTEGELNNQMQIMHQTSALISIAINAPQDFPKDAPKIELVNNLSEEEKEQRRLKNLKATACRIWSM